MDQEMMHVAKAILESRLSAQEIVTLLIDSGYSDAAQEFSRAAKRYQNFLDRIGEIP